MAATMVASHAGVVLRQNATLALSAPPNGSMISGSAAISRIDCTLFSRPNMHNAAASAKTRGPGGDQLAARGGRSRGDAARESKGERGEHPHPPVAQHGARQHGEDQH